MYNHKKNILLKNKNAIFLFSRLSYLFEPVLTCYYLHVITFLYKYHN